MPKVSPALAKKLSPKRVVVRKRAAKKGVKPHLDLSLVATKPLKGREALDLLKAIGIVTPSGKLALAYS